MSNYEWVTWLVFIAIAVAIIILAFGHWIASKLWPEDTSLPPPSRTCERDAFKGVGQ